ncbi:MAG TPA: hypothetical protein VHO25_15890 [Polyangiaceae bacterium]|nr:hypothetical protein [Polyangiaceae bacterium]
MLSIDDEETRYTSTVTTSGTTFTATDTCPAPETETLPYTATATNLWFFEISAAGKLVEVFGKQ